jgi:hypothetical protein
MGCTCKNLPNHPIQFATLEIEINLQPEDRNTKATVAVAFSISERRGWIVGARAQTIL